MTEPTGKNQPRFASTINQAIEFANVGQFSQALQLVSGLVAEFGEAASARGYLAWFLLESGRTEEAIAHSRQAISLAPRSEKASLIHFHALCQARKYLEALDEMKRFLMIRPSEEYGKIIRQWGPD